MVVRYIRMAKETEARKHRHVVKLIVRFVLIGLGCLLASAASFVFLPSIEISTRYPLRSFNLSGYIGMVAFIAVVFAVEGFRGGLKSERIGCIAALHVRCLSLFRHGGLFASLSWEDETPVFVNYGCKLSRSEGELDRGDSCRTPIRNYHCF